MATNDLNRLRKLAAALGIGSLLVFGATACDDVEDDNVENTEAPTEQQEMPAPGVDDGVVDDGMDDGGMPDGGDGGDGGLDDTDGDMDDN